MDLIISANAEIRRNEDVFKALSKKFNGNVFMLLNKFFGEEFLSGAFQNWSKRLEPERVIKIEEGKSVVDIILGIVAMTSNARSLDAYTVDMLDRGQTKDRIAGVKKALTGYEATLLPAVKVSGGISSTEKAKKASTKSERL